MPSPTKLTGQPPRFYGLLFARLFSERLRPDDTMRDVAHHVLRELGLDYTITLVSGGESGNYEIVMYDRSYGSYFTVKLKWDRDVPTDDLAGVIRAHLRKRLASDDRTSDRRPVRRGSAA